MKPDVLKDKDAEQLFGTLLTVMSRLRGPEGCPWDKKQTHQTLEACLLEEAYEVLAAIDRGDPRHLSEELGDLLLQVVFHAQIARESGAFTIREVLIHLIEKLVRRHPHVFSDQRVEGAEEAIANWEKIKAGEKKPDESLLSGLPMQLPALLRAYRIGSKASRVGFDWPDIQGILLKVREELQELDQEFSRQDPRGMDEEFGDLLFALAQLARFMKLNPEAALRKSTMKFQKRFERMEVKLKAEKRDLHSCSDQEWEELWNWSKTFTDSV